MGSSLIKWLDETAKAHGVSRSQIIDDAIKVYRGEMNETLRHLREELASQEENIKVLQALGKQKEEELARLKASQQMVSNILSPYGGPTSELSKEAKEKARTLRATMANPNNLYELGLLCQSKLESPSTPILGQAFKAWGTWQALWDAVQAAQTAKEGK